MRASTLTATFVPERDSVTNASRITRIMLTQDFDLRGIEPKQDVMLRTPLCSGWMVFLNKKCSLAHVMHQLDASEGTYSRMKVPHVIQKKHPDDIVRYFFYRMRNRYII